MVALRQKIGQMLIMGFEGAVIDEKSPVAHWLRQDGLGGVLLFDMDLKNQVWGKNIQNKAQIELLNHELQNFSKQSSLGAQLPLFIAIDYEGGAVDRLKKVPDCPSTMNPVELVTLSQNSRTALLNTMAETLSNLGFNLNFAPVVDLNLGDEQGIIGKLGRSFSDNPQLVINAAREFVQVFSNHHITCCYKHFPGHGSAISDSHHDSVDVTNTFQYSELEPYKVLLKPKETPAMVMTAHVINRELDASSLPATLSYEILTGCLRKKIGFDGVIVSDDLQMHAVADHFTLEESITLSINGGADMLIFGNQLGYHCAHDLINIIEKLVQTQQIPEARIEQSFQRIKALKELKLQ